MDKRVKLHGLSQKDMNGQRGVATDFHPMDPDNVTTWRYTVQLDSGEAFKVRPANLRAEGTGDSAGARKEKGKGKKSKKGRAGRS